MEILITVGIFPPDIGGPASFVPKISKYIKDNYNYDPEIICLSEKENLDKSSDFYVHRINRNLPIVIRWIKTVFKIYKIGKKKDLIFVNGLGTEVSIANILLKKKIVRKIVGDPVWERLYNKKIIEDNFDKFQTKNYGPYIKLQKSIRNWSIKNTDIVITPSEHLKNFIKKTGYKKNIEVIENGVYINDEKFTPFLSNNLNMIVVSRLVVQKNIDLVIKSVSEIRNININLNIVGEGSELNTLKKLVKKLKKEKNIKFLGKLDTNKISKELTKNDLFIQASNYEGLPHSLLEAINKGIPVISSDSGGCGKLLGNGKRGYIISHPITVTKILDTITEVYENKNEAVNKSLKAKNYLISNHNFETQASKYFQIFKNLISK